MNPQTFKTTLQTIWAQLSDEDKAMMRPYVDGTCSLANGEMPALPSSMGGGCGCGGKCGGGCSGGSCSIGGGNIPGIPTPMNGLPGIPGGNGRNYPACYTACKQVNPCLEPYLQNQALQIDSWSLLELYKNEAQIVHNNVSVGATPFQTDTPLAAGQTILYTQEVGQQLAYIPGALKVKATFSDGNDYQALLSLTLYAGPRGLTGLTSVNGLIRIGRPYTFEDFVCGTACYLAPWPELFNCANQVIPGERAVYVVVEAGALPDNVTVSSLSIVTIKADTPQYVNCCKTLAR